MDCPLHQGNPLKAYLHVSAYPTSADRQDTAVSDGTNGHQQLLQVPHHNSLSCEFTVTVCKICKPAVRHQRPANT